MTVRSPWLDLVVSPRYLEAALDARPPGDLILDGAEGTLRAEVLTHPAGGGYIRSAGRFERVRPAGGAYVVRFTGSGLAEGAWSASIEGASALAPEGGEPIEGPVFVFRGKPGESDAPAAAAAAAPSSSSSGGLVFGLLALALLLRK